MNDLPYNINDKKSIIDYAKKLEGKTLREVCSSIVFDDNNNKGGFGQLLEKYYFQYEPNSNSEADFANVNLELKSSPLKKLKNSKLVSKERLVLNIINYIDVITQNFEKSSFLKKNKNLLLIFYLYELEKMKIDYKIKIVDKWVFPQIDLEIIKKDWQTITDKIARGKAHELSEGDTLYLGACTKGSKGGNLRIQPNSTIKAKQRAYSLKQGYVNHIIASLSQNRKEKSGKLIQSLNLIKNNSLEDIVINKLKKYYSMSIKEIQRDLNIQLNQKAKNFNANLTKAMLNIELDREIEEFKKADIIVKTIRLKKNNLPKEDLSFPAFKFKELVNQSWEDSILKDYVEKKFLLIFFKYYGNKLIFEKALFWNMPNDNIEEAKRVWVKTKCIIKNGNIVREIKIDKNGKKSRVTNFPNKKFSNIVHVRPHARDSNDTYPLPKMDKFTKERNYTKQCFWLNSQYVKEIFLEKDEGNKC